MKSVGLIVVDVVVCCWSDCEDEDDEDWGDDINPGELAEIFDEFELLGEKGKQYVDGGVEVEDEEDDDDDKGDDIGNRWEWRCWWLEGGGG